MEKENDWQSLLVCSSIIGSIEFSFIHIVWYEIYSYTVQFKPIASFNPHSEHAQGDGGKKQLSLTRKKPLAESDWELRRLERRDNQQYTSKPGIPAEKEKHKLMTVEWVIHIRTWFHPLFNSELYTLMAFPGNTVCLSRLSHLLTCLSCIAASMCHVSHAEVFLCVLLCWQSLVSGL